METHAEFFRKTLKEFRVADELLSKRLKAAEVTASAEQAEATDRAEEAERIATDYLRAIEAENSPSVNFDDIRVSPEIDGDFSALKILAVKVSEIKKELKQFNNQIKSLKEDFEQALSQEEQERQRLEQARQEALLKEAADRRKRRIRRAIIATAAICTLVILHFWLLNGTTMSFTLTLDGKDFPSGASPVVTVDGKPFVSEGKINLGRHQIAVAFPGAEAFAKKFLIFYGKNDLGILPLESSKGSLSVTVNPSPATFILQRDGEIIRQGDAPLSIDALRVGDYTLFIMRGGYEETRQITVKREQQTKEQVDLDLGSADLSAEPPDAEFVLSGNNNSRRWQGKLPAKIDEIPGGNYSLTVSRKGWILDTVILISRGNVTTNKTEFRYGSIELTSEPTGLAISTNGVGIGNTPMTFQEVIPGQYSFTVSDGENDLITNISVAPKEAAKHVFDFHYGAVQLSSTPAGATVTRNGKVIGKTPLPLNRISAGETIIELQLQDYLSTNVPIQVLEGVTTNVSVKLISEHYIQAMKQAREALDADQFEQASNSVSTAIQYDPTDSSAAALLAEVTAKAGALKQQQLAVEQSAADEKSRKRAAEFAAIPVLDPSALINSCWNPTNHEATDNVNRAVAAPVEIGINIILSPLSLLGKAKGQKNSSIKDVNNAIRFDMSQFYQNWQGKTVSYSGLIESVQVKDRTIVFQKTGSYPREVCVTVSLSQEFADEFQKLKKNDTLTIIGEISSLTAPEVMTLGVNSVVLQNGRIYEKTGGQ